MAKEIDFSSEELEDELVEGEVSFSIGQEVSYLKYLYGCSDRTEGVVVAKVVIASMPGSSYIIGKGVLSSRNCCFHRRHHTEMFSLNK